MTGPSLVEGRYAERLARRVRTESEPWTVRVVSWIDLADLCGELEEEWTRTATPPSEMIQAHEALLRGAIDCGAALLRDIRDHQVDISSSGRSIQVLEASLEMLRVFYDSRHWPASEQPEIETVRARLFNAAA